MSIEDDSSKFLGAIEKLSQPPVTEYSGQVKLNLMTFVLAWVEQWIMEMHKTFRGGSTIFKEI